MSSVILTNWTVYYQSDVGAGNGVKQIRWTGSTGSNTLNELYSALMHLFDNSSQNDADDSIPLRALTPTLYEIGSSDAGDRRPWFIDPESAKHLTGGGLNSNRWTRDTVDRTGSHGIIKITRSGTNIVSGDIGATITNSTHSYDGWLLHVSGNTLYIRPDTSGAGDDWSTGSGTITCNGHSDTQTGAAVSAESMWANIYSLGTIEDATELYIYQNQSQITQWWSTGHIDILMLVQDFGTVSDNGLIVVYARQYSKLYDHYVVDASEGGRIPVPLSTLNDLNNETGFYTLNGSSGVSDFDVGNYIYVGANWGSATKKGVITAVSGTIADPDIEYYLIGDLTNFSASDSLKEYNPLTGANGDGTCTVDSVSDAGPRTSPASTITATFGGTNQDISNGNGSRPYSVTIDCQQVPIEEVYERLKYITRRGETSDIDAGTQTIIGQSYVGVGDYYLPYDTGSTDNPFTEGETLTATGSFSCTLTSKHDQGSSEGFLIVRNVRGTIPVDNTTLTGGTSGHTALIDTDSGNDPVTAIAHTKQSPFGTFAGGTFFGARGVFLSDVASADATAYQLIDSEGVTQNPPNTIPIEISGVVQNTQCYVADSTPTVYLNTTATTLVSGNTYKASTTLTYSTDINVTIKAREMGYLPFESSGTITASGLTVTAVWQTDPNWKLVVSGVNISFTNPSTITRASGDFSSDGWISTMSQVTVEGSAVNDGTYTLSAVGTTTLTITGATLTTAGSASGITLTFTRRSLT